MYVKGNTRLAPRIARTLPLLLLLVSLLVSVPALAAVKTWTNNGGGGDGKWSSDTNWTGGTAPAASDDIVFTSANNYDFPSGSEDEQYRSEQWYARDRLNLQEETLEQLRHLNMGTLDDYVQGNATIAARTAIAAERLRLFYVGVTRARRELIVTYNTGRNADNNPNPPALAFQALVDRQ